MLTVEQIHRAMNEAAPFTSNYTEYPPEMACESANARHLCWQLNMADPDDTTFRVHICQALFGTWDDRVDIRPGFQCDCGYNIHFHGPTSINYDVTILDTSRVDIGKNVMIAPGVRIVPASHSVDAKQRTTGIGTTSPIRIGDNVWIGANAVILGGVTIGNNTVIGAGSVVTHDLPADVVAVGVPCRVMRSIDKRDFLQLTSYKE